MFHQLQHLLHTLHKSFVCVSTEFLPFYEIIMYNTPKVLCIFFHLLIRLQKIHQFLSFFKMYTFMTALKIQFNKIVSNEVKDN